MSRTILHFSLALGLTLAVTATASAGAWVAGGGRVGDSGSAMSFDWANGQDINGLFMSPFLFDDADLPSFVFTTQFLAQTNGDNTQTVADTVSVDITAHPGVTFSGIHIVASGSYNVTAPGGVGVTADLGALELGGLQRSWDGPLTTDVAFPIELFEGDQPQSGNWEGGADIDVTFIFPSPDDEIHVEMTNELVAFSTGSGSASINAQFQNLAIEFVVIPEPASLSLLLAGGLLLLRRR